MARPPERLARSGVAISPARGRLGRFRILQEERAMPEITDRQDVITQINVVDVEPGREAELLALMRERVRFMKTQPGFVSATLHRSLKGTRVVNYVQWTDVESLRAAHHKPEFRDKWPRFGELVKDADPELYELVQVEG
jgi:heme-degrading monooxygenase HmoA